MSVKINEVKDNGGIEHIAFIMDGNGRWAKKRGMAREFGHRAGVKAFETVLERCAHYGIKAVTFYVFSTENWKRSEKEVGALMKLLEDYLSDCEKRLLKKEQDIRFIFLGDKAPFSPSLRKKMEDIEQISAGNSRIVNLALNYGGRDDIVHAFNKLVRDGVTDITEQDVSNALYTNESPELDMIVRTGGDIRLSNFLLWQAAYAELYFTDKLWPDMTDADVDAAIEDFKRRQRRFGGV